MVQPSPRADRVLMQISAVDPAVGGIAQLNLQKLFESRQNPARENVPEGPITA